MKKTQRKDAIRNIQKQFISFLSILIVVAIGVGIFLTCRNGGIALGRDADAFYQQSVYHDMEIRSTKGITEADLDAVRALPGVADAEGIFAVDLVAENHAARTRAHVISLTERMDQLFSVEGTLPDSADTCAVEVEIMERLGLAIGDTIRLCTYANEKSTLLQHETYRITASFRHPDHIHTGDTVDYYVVLPETGFDTTAAGLEHTGMLVRINTDEESSYSEVYAQQIHDVQLSLVTLGKERAAIHDEAILSEARQELEEGEATLAEGKEALESGEAEIDANRERLAQARAELDAAAAQLQAGKTQLGSSEAELEAGKQRLDTARASLERARVQLEEGRSELDAAAAELENGAAQLQTLSGALSDAENQLQDAKEELDAKEKELMEAKIRLDTARTTLDAAEAQIDQERDRINAVFDELYTDLHLEDLGLERARWPEMISIRELTENYTLTLEETFAKHAKNVDWTEEEIALGLDWLAGHPIWNYYKTVYDQLPNGNAAYAEGQKAYEDGKAAWDAGYAEYEAGRAEYEAGLAEYEAGLAEYNEGYLQYQLKENEYDSSMQLYETNLALYNSNREQYLEGIEQYTDAQQQIASGEQELHEKEKEYNAGKEELEAGEHTLQEKNEEYNAGVAAWEEASGQLASYEAGNWILLDRSLNLGWYEVEETRRSFMRIANTFAILFLLLAALVCYATIGKIIDEQRQLVGTTKALGFQRGEIFKKYLCFGVLSAVLGSICGIILAHQVLERIMMHTLGRAFCVDMSGRYFSWPAAVIAILCSALAAGLSTWIACRRLLAQPATRLLKGDIPLRSFRAKRQEDGKRPRSLYQGLIFRNMLNDWKRVLVTVISIAGCCTLLLIGFSMKFSITNVIRRQYGEILSYDVDLRFLPEYAEQVQEDVHAVLSEEGTENMPLYSYSGMVRIGADQKPATILCGDPDALMRFYRLTDAVKKREMRVPEEGVAIHSGLADAYRLQAGDHILLLDESGIYHDVPIAGIYTNYAGASIYLSDTYAEKLFGERAKNNMYAVRLQGSTAESLQEKAADIPGFLSIRSADEERIKCDRASEAMNTVIVVLILMAAIMAAVVLLNLIQIQINQKKKELTVMRINGFTLHETRMYILRENVITVTIGILVGLVIGNIAAQYNMQSVERIELSVIKEINPWACLFSVLITLFFAMLANLFAMQKIGKLQMRDIND